MENLKKSLIGQVYTLRDKCTIVWNVHKMKKATCFDNHNAADDLMVLKSNSSTRYVGK